MSNLPDKNVNTRQKCQIPSHDIQFHHVKYKSEAEGVRAFFGCEPSQSLFHLTNFTKLFQNATNQETPTLNHRVPT